MDRAKSFTLHSAGTIHFFVSDSTGKHSKASTANEVSKRVMNVYDRYIPSLDIFHELKRHKTIPLLWCWPCFKLAKQLGTSVLEVSRALGDETYK